MIQSLDSNSIHSNRSIRRSQKGASLRCLTGANFQNKATTKNSGVEDIYLSTISRNSLRVNTGDIKNRSNHLSILMTILQDPIQCGYLLQFCTLEYNSENLCFIMMVSRFRDAICQDVDAWPKRWTEVDKDISGKDENEIAQNTTWPSAKLNKANISKLIRAIWKEFLSDDAANQIFMPAHVAVNTKRRMLLLDLYGPDVFAEALLDPLETINQDILPRFLFSNLKIDMNRRIKLSKVKLTESDIQVEPPSDTLLQKPQTYFRKKRLFSLNECINNLTLYNEFLNYLQSNTGAKCLLCVRLIHIFEDLCMEWEEYLEPPVEATDCAWEIFRYFVVDEAAGAITLLSRQKKEIMISLAKVHIRMFDELLKTTMSELIAHFKAYKETDSYQDLWQIMAKKKKPDFLGSFLDHNNNMN